MNLFSKCQECEDTGWVKHPAGGLVRCGKCNPPRPGATPPRSGIIADSAQQACLKMLSILSDELGRFRLMS